MKEKEYLDVYDLDKYQRDYWEMNRHHFVECYVEDIDMYTHDQIDNFLEQKEPYEQEYHERLHEAIKLLTPKQQKIIYMYLEGKTQKHIAEELGITQGSINLAINGCIVYRNKWTGEPFDKPRRYGGIVSKLKKIARLPCVITTCRLKVLPRSGAMLSRKITRNSSIFIQRHIKVL